MISSPPPPLFLFSLSLSPPPSLSLSHPPLSLSVSHPLPLSLSHPLSLFLSLTPSLSLSHPLPLFPCLSLSHPPPLFLSLSLSLSLSHTHRFDIGRSECLVLLLAAFCLLSTKLSHDSRHLTLLVVVILNLLSVSFYSYAKFIMLNRSIQN